MNSILHRLKYYGIGFSFGLIFVIFFFKNRGCSWLPDNRVKNSILDRVLVLSDSEAAQLKQFGLKKKDLPLVLNDGEVNFDESKTKGNPKVYVVEKEMEGKGLMKFYFTLPTESFISEIHFSNKNSKEITNTKTGTGELIYFPNDENLVFPDTSATVLCQQEAMHLIGPKEILKLIKKSGRIDFSRSHLSISPKPEHYISFIDKKGRTIGTKAIWYKNKLNITDFELPFKNECK